MGKWIRSNYKVAVAVIGALAGLLVAAAQFYGVLTEPGAKPAAGAAPGGQTANADGENANAINAGGNVTVVTKP